MLLGNGCRIQPAEEVLGGFPAAANTRIPRWWTPGHCLGNTAWLKAQHGEVVKGSGVRCQVQILALPLDSRVALDK